MGTFEVPQKSWARSVQPFDVFLDTNKQTRKVYIIYILDFLLISLVSWTKLKEEYLLLNKLSLPPNILQTKGEELTQGRLGL